MMITNSSNYGCNTSKCVTCNFKFVCASSPYCVVHNISNNSTSDNAINAIIQNQSKIYSSEMDMMQSLNGKIEDISNILSSVVNSINKINEDLYNLNAKKENIEDKQEFKDVEYKESENSQIVPFSVPQEKVMVEKKGLFGRKKWVEEKK